MDTTSISTLTPQQIAAAWRNPQTAAALPAALRAQLPANPAGKVDFSELLAAGEATDFSRNHTHACHTRGCFSHSCASLLCKTSQYHCR